ALALLVRGTVAARAGCGNDANGPANPTTPYGDIPASCTIGAPGLSGPVDLVRDKNGVPHIYATTVGDVAFADGYVMAADRLAQMNLFRHVASGTIAELFGALQAAQIDNDLRMRMHRFRPI